MFGADAAWREADRRIERELTEWLEKHEYESVTQLKGSLSQKNCADPSAFERAQYMRAISSYPMQSDRT